MQWLWRQYSHREILSLYGYQHLQRVQSLGDSKRSGEMLYQEIGGICWRHQIWWREWRQDWSSMLSPEKNWKKEKNSGCFSISEKQIKTHGKRETEREKRRGMIYLIEEFRRFRFEVSSEWRHRHQQTFGVHVREKREKKKWKNKTPTSHSG